MHTHYIIIPYNENNNNYAASNTLKLCTSCATYIPPNAHPTEIGMDPMVKAGVRPKKQKWSNLNLVHEWLDLTHFQP